jgi:hypothetical protein
MTIKRDDQYIIICAHYAERISHALSIYKAKTNDPFYKIFMEITDDLCKKTFHPDGILGSVNGYMADYYYNQDAYKYLNGLDVYKVICSHGGILGDSYIKMSPFLHHTQQGVTLK